MVHWILPFLSLVFSIHVANACNPAPDATHLLINALVGKNGASIIQCWSIEPPFNTSQQAGTVGAKIQAIGDIERATIVYFNPDAPTNAGLHRAPDPQWVLVLQGSALVTLPTTNATLVLPEGDVIIAADTASVSMLGHETKWTKGSVAVQLPFKNQVIPGHTILNPDGPCPPEHGH